MDESATLFVRKATGLVRAWRGFDAFVYAFFSVNLVTLGFFIMSFGPFIPEGHLLPAVLITGVLVTFLVITYAGLIATMPRAGGDYVWQSRILGGGVAFVLSMTGWWFILWHWVPIYGDILSKMFLAPILATLGQVEAALWFDSATGLFVTSFIVMAFVTFYVGIGMSGYAKIQRFCFWGAGVGLVVMFGVMLFSTQADFQQAFNRESAALFGFTGDAYADTLASSAAYGYEPPPFSHMPLGPAVLLIPMVVFYLLWPNWGATLYGEVRGASDYRRVRRGMMYGLWVTVALSAVFFFLVARTFGWEFWNAANSNYWATVYDPEGAPAAAMPLWPHPALLAGWLIDSRAFQLILLLLMGLWFWGWSGTVFLSSTRAIFAAAFDRVLPEWAARVSEKRHVPTSALLLMLVPSVVVSALYAFWPPFITFTLNAVVVIAITFLGTSVAATILPWRRPRIYEGSPVAAYRIGGIPLISVTGAISALFILWMVWHWVTDEVYGVNDPRSFAYLGILYLLAVAIYVGSRVVRSRQGIDLARVHAEIPVE